MSKPKDCPECKGTGWVDCCKGHMCPGEYPCERCKGAGKIVLVMCEKPYRGRALKEGKE